MATDFYSILGLSRDASPDDIKRAYRKLSKELHPDKHKGDADKEKQYQAVNEAYETLSNPKKKQMYDQFGTTGNGSGGYGGFGGGQGFGGFNPEDMGGFSDIFESFFGGQQRGRRPEEQGRNVEVELTVDFDTVIHGGQQTIALEHLVNCKDCDGHGFEQGSKMITCPDCGGTGQVTRTAQSFFGAIQQTAVCQRCAGSGKMPETPCKHCDGEGRRRDHREVNVTIPAGIHDGQTLRLQGEGEAGRRGTEAGDLYVHIRVRDDARYQRDGDDVRSKATISVLDALLGTEIPVETVHGTTTLKVPAGTQPDQVFRIKDKGLPVLNSSKHGDHYVKVTVEVPKKLSRKEKEILEKWKEMQ